MFPTTEAYEAEYEVVERAGEVAREIEKLGVQAKLYPGNQYLLTNLLIDQPDFVLNLVDTLRGKDSLQTSRTGGSRALEPSLHRREHGRPRHRQQPQPFSIYFAHQIDTPEFQFIRRVGTQVDDKLGLPLIVKLNESGGSVGINNKAVQETVKDAQKKVDDMISTYKMPVVVERFIDGTEITAVVFDDGTKTTYY